MTVDTLIKKSKEEHSNKYHFFESYRASAFLIWGDNGVSTLTFSLFFQTAYPKTPAIHDVWEIRVWRSL